ncbi:hypothetical protein V8C86DRAFT_3109878 [Haematococcus lacustris]
MSWVQAARSAAFVALRGSKSQAAQVFHQQTRGMGGGGGGVKLDWHRSYDGKAPPAQYQTPDYVTYAGLTLPRIGRDWDYFIAKGVGAVFWYAANHQPPQHQEQQQQ